MYTLRTAFIRTLYATVAIWVLAACVPAAEPAPPTRTPPPTFTPTPPQEQAVVDPNVAATAQALATLQAAEEPAQPPPAEGQTPAEQEAPQEGEAPPAEEQAAPTDTPTPEPTPTPQVAEVIVNSNINVRQGPGTTYNIIGAANQGERFPVTGKNPAGDWWQIDYRGQPGWVFGQLVTPQNTASVQVAQNIPAAPPPPPPTNTPVPQPPVEQPPAEEPPAEQPAPPPADSGNYPFQLLNTERCDPNEGNTYFNGYVRYKDNSPRNGVCVHVAFYGPRNTKCSGCDGVGDGFWGFSPFGGPAPAGTTVEIFVVTCPGPMPMGGQTEQTGFGDLTPQSPKWVRTIQQSEQCTGITFVGD